VAETCPSAWSTFFDQQQPCSGNGPLFSCLTLQNSIQTVNSPCIFASALLKIALNGCRNSSRNQTLAILAGFWIRACYQTHSSIFLIMSRVYCIQYHGFPSLSVWTASACVNQGHQNYLMRLPNTTNTLSQWVNEVALLWLLLLS